MAQQIIKSLYENYGAWDDPNEEALIVKATVNNPKQLDVHVPFIYGDYFFVETLLKLKRQRNLFWKFFRQSLNCFIL